ncbi:hypothetical protein GE061_008116 [Apolygus lucorum]|uniref:Uncharacterized protein n=1 Tax=Apolygus lucorum TaxID=248454 RepID=A0A8S9WQG6_APOLU|nr:hypothetical protein GE061_008116 [Apolygus lucorum]
MPVSVRLRMVARTAFNRLADEIEQMLDHQDVDYDVLGSKIARLERRIQELEEMDRAILEEMVSVEDMPDVDMDKETKEADDIAIRGKDGKTVSSDTATANGEVMRPLQRVYPLEVCFDDQRT